MAEVVEELRPRPFASTVGVWRVRAGEDSAVLKLVRAGAGTHRHWRSEAEPESAWYWRREPLVYASGLFGGLEHLHAPALRASVERDGGAVALWLEDLGGDSRSGRRPSASVAA